MFAGRYVPLRGVEHALSGAPFSSIQEGRNMKLLDIIELAKQGYKPSDIKELIALADSTEGKEAEQKTEETIPSQEEAEPKEAQEENPVDEAIDYKKLYEEEKQKTDKLQGLFAKKDIMNGETKSDEETVLDFIRDFM